MGNRHHKAMRTALPMGYWKGDRRVWTGDIICELFTHRVAEEQRRGHVKGVKHSIPGRAQDLAVPFPSAAVEGHLMLAEQRQVQPLDWNS